MTNDQRGKECAKTEQTARMKGGEGGRRDANVMCELVTSILTGTNKIKTIFEAMRKILIWAIY